MTPEHTLTPEQLEKIKKAWRGRNPPSKCKGECDLKDLCLMGYACDACGWMEEERFDNKDEALKTT